MALDDLPDTVGLAGILCDDFHAVRKFPVSRQNHAQLVGDEGDVIVFRLVPVAGALLQAIVVSILGALDQLLDTDVFAHVVAGAVQQKQRQTGIIIIE